MSTEAAFSSELALIFMLFFPPIAADEHDRHVSSCFLLLFPYIIEAMHAYLTCLSSWMKKESKVFPCLYSASLVTCLTGFFSRHGHLES